MAALRHGSKCSFSPLAGLLFFPVSRLALNPNLIIEIGSSKQRIGSWWKKLLKWKMIDILLIGLVIC